MVVPPYPSPPPMAQVDERSDERSTPIPREFSNAVLFSPVPTQTLWSAGLIAIAPIDSEPCVSNFGAQLVPPFVDFQTPPSAAPAHSVPVAWPHSALMRPEPGPPPPP